MPSGVPAFSRSVVELDIAISVSPITVLRSCPSHTSAGMPSGVPALYADTKRSAASMLTDSLSEPLHIPTDREGTGVQHGRDILGGKCYALILSVPNDS